MAQIVYATSASFIVEPSQVVEPEGIGSSAAFGSLDSSLDLAWGTIPAISFTDGQSGNYSLRQHLQGDTNSAVAISVNPAFVSPLSLSNGLVVFSNTGGDDTGSQTGRVASAAGLSSNSFGVTIQSASSGNTITATSAQLADPTLLQALIDSGSVSDGDTVLLPDGNVTWTSGISTTKQIIIRAQNMTPISRGRKTQSVVITCNTGPIFNLSSGNTATTGLGGIRFVQGSSTLNQVRMNGGGSNPWVLWDCSFDFSDRYGSSFDNSFLNIQGRGGVVAQCWMEGRGGGPDSFMAGSNILVQNTETWTVNDTMGALDTNGNVNVYFEDCSFLGGGLCPDGDLDARWVQRYCTIDGTWAETHGYTGLRPGRHWEWYNNDIVNTTPDLIPSNRLFWCRGGCGVFADNNYTAVQSPGYGSLVLLQMTIEGDNYGGSTAYPIPGQCGWGYANGAIRRTGIWMWNNGPQGSTWNLNNFRFTNANLANYIQEGREIFTDTQMTVANGAPFDYQKYTYPHPARGNV